MDTEDQLEIEAAAKAIAQETDSEWPHWSAHIDTEGVDRIRLEAQIRAALFLIAHRMRLKYERVGA